MNSLHDTVFRRKENNLIYPVYDDNKTFGEIFDNNKVWCGQDASENKMNDKAFSAFRDVFDEWKKNPDYKKGNNLVLDVKELRIKNDELQKQLDIEKGWWDKWINDKEDSIILETRLKMIDYGWISGRFPEMTIDVAIKNSDNTFGSVKCKGHHATRKLVKLIYEHYINN